MNSNLKSFCCSLLILSLTVMFGTVTLWGNELAVSRKMLHYSNSKSEIYSKNFLPIYNCPVSYAFTYSTSKNAYFCLVLKNKNNELKKLKIKEEHPLLEYKTYDAFLVVISKINPSMDEFYVYDTVNDILKIFYAGELIIIDGKVVSIVYPPHFAADKKTVDIEIDGKKILLLPFSYYSLEKAGTNKVRISDYLNSSPKIDLDQTTVKSDTSIVITI